MTISKFLFSATLAWAVVGCTPQKASQTCEEAPAAPRIVNYVNFLRQNDYRMEDDINLLYHAASEEARLAREYKIPATFLLQYDALIDPAYQKLMKDSLPEGSEIGGWWEITKPHYDAIGEKWPFEQVWYPYDVKDFAIGHTPEVRERLVDEYMAKFKEIFGDYPKSVGSWYIDSYTLNYMYEKYGIEASCVCKEQIGTDGYTLWGGYWSQAFYPSKYDAHMPAQTEEGQIPVPVFRMLGSDPIYQYDYSLGHNGQGVITMEPVYSCAGSDPNWVHYFMESFMNEPCLQFGYVQIGQENSFGWPMIGKGLTMQVALIDSLRQEGKLVYQTLGETARWFRENNKVTPSTAVTCMEDFRNEGNQTVWYNTRFYRTNLLWNPSGFRFRDIYKFDEKFHSRYHSEPASGTKLIYYTLPVADGSRWSESDDRAGFFIELANGERVVLKDPQVEEDRENGTLTITSQDAEGKPCIVFLTETSISVQYDAKDWTLTLSAPRRNMEDMPSLSIADDHTHLNLVSQDFPYSISLSEGTFQEGEGAVLYRILPKDQKITIQMGQ